MKKSVVILIAIIYVASIALVSFFGLQFKVFEEVVSVERVEITNPDQKESATLGSYVVITHDGKGEPRYQIDYHVYPENATNTAVDFSFDATPAGCAEIDEFGVITFKNFEKGKYYTVKVHVVATDGSNAEDTLTVILR